MEPESATISTHMQFDENAAGQGNSHCANCNALLSGKFCSACGQNSADTVVPLKSFLKEGIEDILTFDLRYPRSLRALVFPGRLTARYLLGQRIGFVAPLKFAFNASVLLFACIAIFAPESAQVTVNSEISEDLGYFAREYALWLTLGQLMVLPIWASIIYLGFRNQKPFYLSHLIFALHFHTAVTLAFIVNILLLSLLPLQIAGWFVLAIVILIYGPYLFLALKTVYESTWKKTALYGLVVLFSYMGLLVMVSTIIAVLVIGADSPEG